jgi:bacteriocin biosynthesis cyclodehydratase domain-containing protein
LRRRLGARVVISGRGRLAAPVAVTLAEAGVGHVDPDVPGAVTAAELPGSPLRAADVGRPRAEAIAESVLAAAPETETHSVRRGGASLIVQLGFEQPVALLAASHVARRQAHLAVTIRDGSVLIGPLVRPTGKPCLNCVELHRRDRDAGWPTPGVTPGNAVEPCTVATLLAATAFAAGEVLEFLDGGTPQTLGAAVEISGPGRFRRRTWPPHPGCTCAGRPRRSAQTVKHMARLGADQADPGGSMPHRRSQ